MDDDLKREIIALIKQYSINSGQNRTISHETTMRSGCEQAQTTELIHEVPIRFSEREFIWVEEMAHKYWGHKTLSSVMRSIIMEKINEYVKKKTKNLEPFERI